MYSRALLVLIPLVLCSCETEDPFEDTASDSEIAGAEYGVADPVCSDPPVIQHEELNSAQPSNADVQILAYVYENDDCNVGIMTVDLYYRGETATEWNKITMTPGQESNQWRGMIAAHALVSAKIYYYIRAEDGAGREAVDPADADISLLNAYFFGVSTS